MARSLIALTSEPRPLDGWFRAQSGSAELQLRGTVALEITSLLEQVKVPKTSTLTASIERAERGLLSLRLESEGIQQKWETFVPVVKAIRDNNERVDGIAQSIRDLDGDDTEGGVAFAGVAARLAKTLGLPHADPPTRAAANPASLTPFITYGGITYGGGVLRGLPVLPQIPDGITNLTELATKLSSAGGAVSTTGRNAHEEFLAELTSIRVVTTKLVEDRLRRTAQRESLRIERNSLLAESERQQPRLLVLGEDVIVTVVSPADRAVK